MQETWVWSQGWEDPLKKGMATHSSILAWEIPWTEEPGGLQSLGSQRVGHDWERLTHRRSRPPGKLLSLYPHLKEEKGELEENMSLARTHPGGQDRGILWDEKLLGHTTLLRRYTPSAQCCVSHIDCSQTSANGFNYYERIWGSNRSDKRKDQWHMGLPLRAAQVHKWRRNSAQRLPTPAPICWAQLHPPHRTPFTAWLEGEVAFPGNPSQLLGAVMAAG